MDFPEIAWVRNESQYDPASPLMGEGRVGVVKGGGAVKGCPLKIRMNLNIKELCPEGRSGYENQRIF